MRDRFAAPHHAGELRGSGGQVLSAEVAESADGARILLCARIEDGTIAALAYRVFGCPHLIAALEYFCERSEGLPVSALEKPDFADITLEMELPVEKSGRILLLEDAVARIWSQQAATAH